MEKKYVWPLLVEDDVYRRSAIVRVRFNLPSLYYFKCTACSVTIETAVGEKEYHWGWGEDIAEQMFGDGSAELDVVRAWCKFINGSEAVQNGVPRPDGVVAGSKAYADARADALRAFAESLGLLGIASKSSGALFTPETLRHFRERNNAAEKASKAQKTRRRKSGKDTQPPLRPV